MLVDLAVLHDLLQLGADALAQQVPLPAARHGDDDSILRSGELPQDVELVQSASQHPDKIFYSNVVSEGDPLGTLSPR